jgi:hypothetical protein
VEREGIFPIFSRFNLLFFHISIFVHYSTFFSFLCSISFHYSTYISSIFSLSFHYSTYFTENMEEM